jgi:hypothetical protein
MATIGIATGSQMRSQKSFVRSVWGRVPAALLGMSFAAI